VKTFSIGSGALLNASEGVWVWMRGGSGKVDSSGAGVYGRPTSPPLEGVLLRAQGRGLREEGGRTKREHLQSWQEMSIRKERTML
jgi:hypothetical protein